MSEIDDLAAVARELRKRLGTSAFVSMTRREVTDLLREVTGEPSARIKDRKASLLEEAMLEIGVDCFPGIVGSHPTDIIRIYHADTALAKLIHLFVEPDKSADSELSDVLNKIKNKWDWSAKTFEAA